MTHPAILETIEAFGETTLMTDAGSIVELCRFLKDEEKFIRLSAVTAVDWHPAEPRFEVVYHLHSIEQNKRLRVKCRLSGKNPEIDSMVPVWTGANWYEREVYDMFGITFRNHQPGSYLESHGLGGLSLAEGLPCSRPQIRLHQ